MASVLLLYGTSEGQTGTVAERMGAVIEASGHHVALVNARHLPRGFDLAAYDAAIVGASVHLGRHQKAVGRFVHEHADALNAMPAAFVSVSLSAAGDEENRAAAEETIDSFLADTGFEPDRALSVAGALKYSEYGLLKRFVMTRVSGEYGGDTDPSRDYEYTAWDTVEAFAAAFASELE